MTNPTPYGVPGEQGTPWPQYGQNGAPAPGVPLGGPVVMPPAKLPSRAPGTLLIVVGVILMIVVAPVVFGVIMVRGFSQIANSTVEGVTVSNGETVEVNATGSYTVMFGSEEADSCALIDSGNNAHEMTAFQGEKAIYSVSGLSAGTYTVNCEGLSKNAVITGMNLAAQDFLSSTTSALLWGTVIGVAGIIMLIIGIVLVVRANTKRQEIRQQTMMSAIR